MPTDEPELLEKFREGMFEEKNWCELKREVPKGPAANLELARDLSSLAVDGGTLIIGLDEKAPEGNPLHPVQLRSLCERIEEVAQTRAQPPLQVETTSIDATDQPGLGYVIVHVPASPLAPHQVLGAYYGRGDKKKRPLSDAEVERLFERRAKWGRNTMAMLEEFVTERVNAFGLEPSVVLVARPVGGWPEMFRELVGTASWRQSLAEIVKEVSTDQDVLRVIRVLSGPNTPPETMSMKQYAKTTTGVRAIVSTGPPASPTQGPAFSELHIDESGTIRLVVDVIGKRAMRPGFGGDPNISYVHFHYDHAAGVVFEVLTLLRTLSRRVGYSSAWDISVAFENMASSSAMSRATPSNALLLHPPEVYGQPNYRHSSRASVLDLERAPGPVVERLIGLYSRSTQVDHELQVVFDWTRESD